MLLTDRFVAVLPGQDVPLSALSPYQRLAKARQMQVLVNDPFFLAIKSTSSNCLSTSASLILDVYPGAMPYCNLNTLGDPSLELIYNLLRSKLQIFNLISVTTSSFTITSDPLGIKPYYYAKTLSGHIVASRLEDLKYFEPSLNFSLDHLSLIEAFIFDSPKGNRTLHTDIYRPHAGESISWIMSKGFEVSKNRGIQVPPVNNQIDTKGAIAFLFDTYTTSLKTFLKEISATPIITLTGGFDSRLIACLVNAIGKTATTVTLGYRKYDEFQVAARIAKLLGFPHRLIEPIKTLSDNIDICVNTFEGQVGPETTFITNLPSPRDEIPPQLLHGFIGDALSGSYLGWIPPGGEHISLDEVAHGIVFKHTRGLSADFSKLLGLRKSFEDVKQVVFDELNRQGSPRQALLLWNIENRQRRHISPQVSYAYRHYHVYAPSYASEVITAWLTLPRAMHQDRSLLRKLFEERFPHIAALPHCDEDNLIWPRNWQALTYWSRQVRRRVRAKVATFVSKTGRSSDHEIWSMWLGTTDEQRAFMQRRLRETFPAVTNAFGYSLPMLDHELCQQLATTANRQGTLLRRALVVAEYAERFPR